MAGQETIELLVTVDDAHVGDLPALAERLRAAGMSVESVLDAIGTISGRAPAALVAGLAGLEGVSAVEMSRDVRLVSPDSSDPRSG